MPLACHVLDSRKNPSTDARIDLISASLTISYFIRFGFLFCVNKNSLCVERDRTGAYEMSARLELNVLPDLLYNNYYFYRRRITLCW